MKLNEEMKENAVGWNNGKKSGIFFHLFQFPLQYKAYTYKNETKWRNRGFMALFWYFLFLTLKNLKKNWFLLIVSFSRAQKRETNEEMKQNAVKQIAVGTVSVTNRNWMVIYLLIDLHVIIALPSTVANQSGVFPLFLVALL